MVGGVVVHAIPVRCDWRIVRSSANCALRARLALIVIAVEPEASFAEALRRVDCPGTWLKLHLGITDRK